MAMRSDRVARVAGIGIVLAATVALTGCEASGGGWAGGTSPKNARITLGFALECNPFGAATPESSMSYIDRGYVNGAIEGLSVEIVPGSCADEGNRWTGTYRSRPKGAGGTAVVTFKDTGVTGPSKGDEVTVELTGGLFGGYRTTATLGGGNITVIS
jgi:hypothetical protein